jgi:glucose/arabinose dehydrogenase
MRVARYGLCLILAACGTAATTNGQANNGAAVDLGGAATQTDRPFAITPVATFDNPWAMAFLPNSTMALVTEKPGHIWLVDVRNGAKQPIAGAPRVIISSQGGLLDVALSPTFASDNLVYLTYAEPSANGGSGLALARAKLVRDAAGGYLDGRTVLWHDPAGGQGGQFGAIIAFGPDGKSLFLSSGERQRFTPAQDPNQPLGKILHLTLDGKPAPGNPWAGKQGATAVTLIDPPEDTIAAQTEQGRKVSVPAPNMTPAETWTLGHRNQYGLAFDAEGRLWETEMGPRGGDELNLIEKGRNYGWPLVSYGINYNGKPIPSHDSSDKFQKPLLYWTPIIAPAGLTFYYGSLFPQWKGSAFIGALGGTGLIRIAFDGGAHQANRWNLGHRIRDVVAGPDGALWLIEDETNGRLLRLTPK